MTDKLRKRCRKIDWVVQAAPILVAGSLLSGSYLVCSPGEMTVAEARRREAYITLADPEKASELTSGSWREVELVSSFLYVQKAKVILPGDSPSNGNKSLVIKNNWIGYKAFAENLVNKVVEANLDYKHRGQLEALRDIVGRAPYDDIRVNRVESSAPEQEVWFADGLVQIKYNRNCQLEYVWVGIPESAEATNAEDMALLRNTGSLIVDARYSSPNRHFLGEEENSLNSSAEVVTASGWVAETALTALDQIRDLNGGFPMSCDNYREQSD